MSVAPKEQVVAGLPTKSAKIRALHRTGYSRAEIAKFLNIRYQHVRNVLERDATREADMKSANTHSKPEKDELLPVWVRLGPDGRVVIPAALREALGLKEGEPLLAEIGGDGEVHLLTRKAAVRRSQAFVRQFIPEGVSLVDELLEERRREAAREDEENG
jgi:AbrB family looped-hinge helix DNA binding protein